jgi:hypothetical protein
MYDVLATESKLSNNGRLPKMNFPTYEGEYTRLWVQQAEDYFDMYDVPPHRWVKVSRMNFRGVAAHWIESLAHPDRIPWPNFCKQLHDCFGHDQCDRLVRQMFHISQLTTVQDYVERFSTLFDQLKAYEPNPDLHYYTTRFVDGLWANIRAVVTLQRPANLDTAYTLALLQEEVGDDARKCEFHTPDRGASNKVQGWGTWHVPRALVQATAEKPVLHPPAQASDDKMAALCKFRRARGLCDFCAEKWSHGHKCAPTIPLNAMQEIWDLFQLSVVSEEQSDDIEATDTPDKQLFLPISSEAQRGSNGHHTIQFLGSIGNIPVIVLVDSGSSASFLATSIADQLPHLPRAPMTTKVKIANGNILWCTSALLGCEFILGDHSF